MTEGSTQKTENITLPEGQASFTKLAYEAAPVRTLEQFDAVHAEVQALFEQEDAPSYGAYHFPGVGDAGLTAIHDIIPTVGVAFDQTRDHAGLHQDSREINAATYYYVKAGNIDFVMLIGSKIYDPSTLPNDRTPVQQRRHSDLITHEVLDRALASDPERAIRVRLSPGDVLIFDDSQPHMFKTAADSPDGMRLARGFWKDQIKPKATQPHKVGELVTKVQAG